MSENTRTRSSSDPETPETPEESVPRDISDEVREQFDRFLELRATVRKAVGSKRRERLARLLS